MDLSNLGAWQADAADLRREKIKRLYSPSSFFFSQGHAIVLSAAYFTGKRLTSGARSGVANKHLRRIHLALFGQLLASLEYLLKDFVAQVTDMTDIYDERLKRARWISVDTALILYARTVSQTPGALLLHPTLGWHDPEIVNARYSELFQHAPIANEEIQTLSRLWILRHSVAHNAGFVTSADAARAGLPHLSAEVAHIDASLIQETFDFLAPIAKRVATDVADKVLLAWLKARAPSGPDYPRDKNLYQRFKLLATYVESRSEDLPTITKGAYTQDFRRANPPAAPG